MHLIKINVKQIISWGDFGPSRGQDGDVGKQTKRAPWIALWSLTY